MNEDGGMVLEHTSEVQVGKSFATLIIILLTVIVIELGWIALNTTPTADASRQIMDVNIVKVGDRFIGTAVPVTK